MLTDPSALVDLRQWALFLKMVDQTTADRRQSTECPYVAAAGEPFERHCETSGEPLELRAAAAEEEAFPDGRGAALEDMEDKLIAERRAAQRKVDVASSDTELEVREDAFADDEASSVLQLVEACSILARSVWLPGYDKGSGLAVVQRSP